MPALPLKPSMSSPKMTSSLANTAVPALGVKRLSGQTCRLAAAAEGEHAANESTAPFGDLGRTARDTLACPDRPPSYGFAGGRGSFGHGLYRARRLGVGRDGHHGQRKGCKNGKKQAHFVLLLLGFLVPRKNGGDALKVP
jgi:hypothetical protein